MNIFHLFLFFIFLFIGIITIYTDVKFLKIRNKWIILGFVLGIIIYIFNFIFNYDDIFLLDFLYFILNLFITLFVGIFLWIRNVWNPGDAKFYFLLVFLIPFSFYEFGFIKYFPGIVVLVNSFVFMIIYVIFEMIFRFKFKNKDKIFSDLFKFNNSFYHVFVSFFLFHWLSNLFLFYFNFGIPMIFIVFLSFISQGIIKILFKRIWYIFVFLIVFRMFLDKSIYSLFFLQDIIKFILFYFLFFILFSEFPKRFFSKKIGISDLKVGMILKDNIPILDEKKSIRDDNLKIAVYKKPSGVNGKEIKKLNELLLKNKILKDIEIVEHSFFAPYLFLGTLFLFIFKGSVFYFIKIIFNFLF